MRAIFCFLAILTSVSSFAIAHEAPCKFKKIYVSQENVRVTETGILVKIRDRVFPVKNLRSDKKGIYVLENEIDSALKKSIRYYCRRCPRSFESRADLERHEYYEHSW